MKKNTILLIIYLIFIQLLSGCQFNNNIAQKKPDVIESECRDLNNTLAFPLGEYIEPYQIYKNVDNFWNKESEIPGYSNVDLVYYNGAIWYQGTSGLSKNSIYRYDIETKMIKYYSLHVNENIPLINWLVSKNDDLWGIIGYDNTSIPLKNSTILLHYNEDLDQFEYVDDKTHKFSLLFYDMNDKKIASDAQGILWITFSNGLYKFDPDTLVVNIEYKLDKGDQLNHINIDDNGTIWFINETGNGLISYSANNESAESTYLPTYFFNENTYNTEKTTDENIDQIKTSFLDTNGRLWLDDKGWYSINETNIEGGAIWYQIIRSPAFITPLKTAGYNQVVWEIPERITQTSDGLIWFEGPYSVVTLDFENANWCKLIYDIPLPVEDENKTLWTVSYENNIPYLFSRSID